MIVDNECYQLADIRQAVLHGLARLADICQTVLQGLANIRQTVLSRRAKLTSTFSRVLARVRVNSARVAIA